MALNVQQEGPDQPFPIKEYTQFIIDQQTSTRKFRIPDLPHKSNDLPIIQHDFVVRAIMELAYIFGIANLGCFQLSTPILFADDCMKPASSSMVLIICCQQHRDSRGQINSHSQTLVDMFIRTIDWLCKCITEYKTSNSKEQIALRNELLGLTKDHRNALTKAKNFDQLLSRLERSLVFAPRSALCMMGNSLYCSNLIREPRNLLQMLGLNDQLAALLVNVKNKEITNERRAEEMVRQTESIIQNMLKIHFKEDYEWSSIEVRNQQYFGVLMKFRKPLTPLQAGRSINEGLPKARQAIFQLLVEVSQADCSMRSCVKLTTKHEMVVEHSDVFSRQLGRMMGEGFGYVYELLPHDDRKYIGVKMNEFYKSYQNILIGVMFSMDYLLTLSILFDVDYKNLYSPNSNDEYGFNAQAIVIHYSSILDTIKNAFVQYNRQPIYRSPSRPPPRS